MEPNTKGAAGVSSQQIVWTAGFFEGEANFCSRKITVAQVQREPLERLQKLYGGTISFITVKKPPFNSYHRWNLYGDKAEWLQSIIFDLMSPRRQAQIQKCIEMRHNGDFYCKNGHPKSEENLTVVDINGFRSCRLCARVNGRAFKHRKRMAEAGHRA